MRGGLFLEALAQVAEVEFLLLPVFGAASGPLFAALAIVARLRGYGKGAYPLLWAGSDRGYRSAVALALAQD